MEEKHTVSTVFQDWCNRIKEGNAMVPPVAARYPLEGTIKTDIGEVYFVSDPATGDRDMVVKTPEGETKTYKNVQPVSFDPHEETFDLASVLNVEIQFDRSFTHPQQDNKENHDPA